MVSTLTMKSQDSDTRCKYADDVKETFGERLRRLREAKKLTQDRLAELSGVGRGAIAMLETGKSGQPDSDNLMALAAALEVPPAELLGRELRQPSAVYRRAAPIRGFVIATPDQDGYFDDMGYPVEAGEAYAPYGGRDPDAYAVTVRGDSMQPRIRPGEIIVAEPNRIPVPLVDDVIVRCKNGRKMVKQLLGMTETEVVLGSINQNHKQMTISIEEVESVHRIFAIHPRGSVIDG